MQLRSATHRDKWGQNTKHVQFVCRNNSEAQLVIQHKQRQYSLEKMMVGIFGLYSVSQWTVNGLRMNVVSGLRMHLCGVIYFYA